MSETCLEFRILGLDERLDDGLAVSGFNDSIRDPVGDFCRKAADDQIGKASGAWDWNEPVSSAAPLHKSAADEWRELRKSVTRTEQFVIDGERWIHAFDRNGVLVDARILIDSDAA